MKTSKLKTSINNKYIFKLKDLSYHTKCILSKLITDLIHGDEPLDLLYLEENIFSTWPQKIVSKALDEMHDNEIMGLTECEGCDDEECENMFIVFNPEFLQKACPYISSCPCCGPAPVNFNINYN